MNKLVLAFLLLFSLTGVAQDINQFNANGERQGKWTKNFKDTDQPRYEGQFENGKETGLFKYYKLVNGKSALSATKDFDASTGIAKVEFLSSKGKLISKGLMKGRNYIGLWTYYHNKSNGILSTEKYDENGLRQGEKVVFYENGKVAERVIYKDDKIDGLNVWYGEDGKILKEMNYLDGKLHGEARYFNPEGVLVAEGQYKNNKKHGIWKYFENDTLKEEKDFTLKSKNPKFKDKN